MEEALRAFLLASAGITGLGVSKIAWGILPQGSPLPLIALHLVSAPYTATMKKHRIGLVGRLVQIDCWADAPVTATALGRAVIAALAGLNTPPFSAAFIENERASFEADDAPQGAGQTGFHRTSLDVRVWSTDP